jgi:23S rRNA (uracil1939-C5)-methyltransferase
MQVNSAGAALLYKLAGDLAQPTRDDVLLDLFCGCGSFGLMLAHTCAPLSPDLCLCCVDAAPASAAAAG